MTQTDPFGHDLLDDDLGDDVPAFDVPDDVPAAEGSALIGLRARIRAAADVLHFDLEVPRISPPVYVRFKPVPLRRLQHLGQRMTKSKDPDASLLANAAMLAEACLGVFEVIDGAEVSIDPDDRDGAWPKFDKRLGALLGITATRAVDVVRALYLTEGDIVSTVDELTSRSGFAQEQLERDAEGN